jgi:hypothetical protein
MNPKVIVALAILAAAPPLRADDTAPAAPPSPTQAQAATTALRQPAPSRNLLNANPRPPAEPAVVDPLAPSHHFLEEFRLHRYASDRSLGQRVLDLPVIRLLIPQRIPSAPGGTGHYFAWGDSSRPWTAIAAGGAPQDGFTSSVNNKPHNGFILTDW